MSIETDRRRWVGRYSMTRSNRFGDQMALWRENKEVESKVTAQFQSSMTEWIGLPFSKLDNLGNKLVRYLEFHLWCVVF